MAYIEETVLKPVDLTDAGKRIPICFCIDVSGSMNSMADFTGAVETEEEGYTDGRKVKYWTGGKSYMDLVNEGIKELFDILDEYSDGARYSTEIAIVTFADGVRVVHDFTLASTLEGKFEPIVADGDLTDLAGGVDICLDLLEIRKLKYKQVKQEYIQPWLFILSDGDSTTDTTLVKQKARDAERRNKLSVYPFAIKSAVEINIDDLKGFTIQDRVYPLDKDIIKQFFRVIAQSISSASTDDDSSISLNFSDIFK